MINVDIFHKRLNTKKCLKNNFNLTEEEYLISKKSFPKLYQNIFDETEKEYIKVVLSFIHKNNRYILNKEKKHLNEVRNFFNLLFKIGDKYIKERETHLYIFLFWESLIWDKKVVKNLDREHFFYEGQIANSEDKFQKNLLPYISNNCDLIYHNNDDSRIELIEIKNVDLDDRAISQIQRYYRTTNLVCETREHNLKILNLKPTLIIKHQSLVYKSGKTPLLQYWLTFPTYFRELLEIYSFSYCTENKTLKLTDLKPKLKTLIKEEANPK